MSEIRKWVGDMEQFIFSFLCAVAAILAIAIILFGGMKMGYDMGIVRGTQAQETLWENLE